MALRVALHHLTRYTYDRPISLGPQVIRLRPAPHCRTPPATYSLKIRPDEHFINWQQDPYGNFLARVVVPEKTQVFEHEVDLVAELETLNPFDFFLDESAERYPFSYVDAERRQLEPFLEPTSTGPLFAALFERIGRSNQKTIDLLVAVNQLVNEELDYLIRMEAGVQGPERTLELGRGSCRDFAWLLVHLLRRLGIAARFVSGYSIQLKPDQKPLEGPAGVAEDVVDLHAWAEAYLPGAGWVGLDATSGLLAGEGHIPLACAADPESAAPISGALEDCETSFDVTMTVKRLDEAPRSTKPFEDATWRRVLMAGRRVDELLERAEVDLTVGGEPTFVSSEDFVSDEWTTAAAGPHKRRTGEALIRRLRDRFAPGALLHYGQGKWYPGESLPRWALSCFFRRDGEPIWTNDEALALPRQEPTEPESAQEFAAAVAESLDVETDHVQPAYEDPLYFLWKEQRLPGDVDPTDPKLEDPEERERLARVFGRGLREPVGWVLPIECQRQGEKLVWRSGLWMLRSRHIVLAPGDSPVGLRLPLDSLPGQASWSPLSLLPPDPLAPRPALPPRRRLARDQSQPRPERPKPERPNGQRLGESPPGGTVVRTALCVEVRDGRIEVFLPPVPDLESYLQLVATIEDTATRQGQRVVITGYPPPHDSRINEIKVTPDPGVLEVNIHPASSFDETLDIVEGLFEDARQCRLQAMKHLVDGREVGTGGGNHIVIGASEPARSPFLQRPDVLASLIGFWVNHPSLSYLFSGLFIGPTSQAPRIDEARHDSLYELEVAFAQLSSGGPTPPWLVDRLFRNLLIDSSGNTHRTEICIDKLYSPDSASGRLGLVELRSFEMAPHPAMNLVQHLLVRGLIAHFWERPYSHALERWGTRLSDRFMLPYFIEQDFHEVIAEISPTLELDWEMFRPQFEFRFPLIGAFEWQGTTVEIRTALEPWHVLGEEPGGGGTVRYVDSSLERLQVHVRGLDPERYTVCCNRLELPLQPTRHHGERVAGVRFRAWQPPEALHPTIGVHAPLVFDLVDKSHSRATAGCTFWVGHPGGRNYDEPPVNALEAESRRRGRFQAFGHTPGEMAYRTALPDPEFPHTLDMRRF